MLTISDPITVANGLRPMLLHLNRRLRQGARAARHHRRAGSRFSGRSARSPAIGVRELADREGVSPPAMTAYVDRLEAAGLVARRRSEHRPAPGRAGADRRRRCGSSARLGAAAPPGSRRGCSASSPTSSTRSRRRFRRSGNCSRTTRDGRAPAGQPPHLVRACASTGTTGSSSRARSSRSRGRGCRTSRPRGSCSSSPTLRSRSGFLMLCQFLPATVLGLFSGVLVDRLDVRRTVIVTQAASMVFAAALAA